MHFPPLIHSLCIISAASLLIVPTVQASGAAPPVPSAETIRLRDFKRPATTLKEWEAKLKNSKLISQNTPVTITDVQLNRVEEGLDVVLETEEGKPLSVDATNFRAEGTSLIADISNAVLALPNAQEFSAENPIEDIANVRVTQLNASTIRVSVTGNKALPTSEVTLRTGALAYSLNPEEEDLDEEIVVTGEGQRGYFAPNSSTATKTDTPILDIPGSVQVVPRQVLNDQRVIRVGDAVQNVSGVSNLGQYQGYEDLIFLRGFQVSTFQGSFFRDGVRTFTFGSPDTTNLERIEVLKGPASILFGQVEPGGIINLVTKQPLRDPYYAAQLTIGNFDTYEGALDLSGPLNDEKTILYRLNTSYRTAGSFRDFVDKERFFLAPSLTFQLGSNTSLRLDAEYTDDSVSYDTGLVAIGDRPANIPIGRFLNEPFSNFSKEEFGVGYVFNHRFNDNWSVRNNFRYQKQRPERYGPQPDALDEVTGELLRSQYWAGGYYENFFTDTNVLGKFSTGSIAHQLLFGFEYSKTIEKPEFRFGFEYP